MCFPIFLSEKCKEKPFLQLHMKESTESNVFILVTAEIKDDVALYEIVDGAQGQGGGRGGEGGGGEGMGGVGHKGTGKSRWEEGELPWNRI